MYCITHDFLGDDRKKRMCVYANSTMTFGSGVFSLFKITGDASDRYYYPLYLCVTSDGVWELTWNAWPQLQTAAGGAGGHLDRQKRGHQQ